MKYEDAVQKWFFLFWWWRRNIWEEKKLKKADKTWTDFSFEGNIEKSNKKCGISTKEQTIEIGINRLIYNNLRASVNDEL